MRDDANSERVGEFLSTELRWARAHLELDLDTIEHILSDGCRQIQADGSFIRKDQLLTSYRSGGRRWEIAESSDHDIQIFDDVAILLGRWTGKGVNAGEKFDYTAGFLAVYILEYGYWKLHLELSIPLAQSPGIVGQRRTGMNPVRGTRRDVG